ncbi:hypothetical protein HPT27_14070 [Permianibacter sp. IMCC34836]|uniref:hypothetical protein n=1 Tax=Permianibacter fluminis TaxID=2738515 RepID=UPI001554AADB|nr:hypothetical protein [Permianibacter fluminis]NQD38153.1 hypothetical protein [Permianibacter fluminis]
MRLEIIKVNADRLDPECLVVTLRHVPGSIARFMLGARDKVVTYKGQVSAWYVPPSFRPADADTSRFLDSIASSREFAHLRPARRS